MSKPLQGAYIQELLTYRFPKIRQQVRALGELGSTALAFNLWAPTPTTVGGLAHPVPWGGGNILNAKDKYWRAIDHVLEQASPYNIRVYVYGPMFPDFWFAEDRGLVPTIESIRLGRENTMVSEWRTFSGKARTGWLHHWDRVINRYGDQLAYVDGTESYMSAYGTAPNEFSRIIEALTPASLALYTNVGPDPTLVGRREEAHLNPGDEYLFGGQGGIICTDGPGVSQAQWEVPDGPPIQYVGLPPGHTPKKVADWFIQSYHASARDNRDAFLVLLTTGWGWPWPRSNPDPPRKGVVFDKRIQPWHRIFGRLGEAGS